MLVFTLRRVPSHACGSSQPQLSASWGIDQECSSVNSCKASDHQGWRTLPWGNTSCLLWGCQPADCQSCQPQKTLTQRFSLWLKAFSAAKGLGDQRSKNTPEVQSQISKLKSAGNSNCHPCPEDLLLKHRAKNVPNKTCTYRCKCLSLVLYFALSYSLSSFLICPDNINKKISERETEVHRQSH